jgi:hypothetical protein
MAVQGFGEIPFGLRDIRLTPWVAGALSTTLILDYPRIQTLEVNIARDSADLEGDDVRIASHSFATRIEGTLTAGGINLAVVAMLTGGSTTGPSGTAPAKTTTFILEGDDTETYFKAEGQSLADDGGDVHVTIWHAKATSGPNWSFNQGEFTVSACDIVGTYDQTATPTRLVTVVQNQTAVPLAAAIP